MFQIKINGANFSESVMYSFTGANGDGAYPWGALLPGTDGDLYGTTAYSGDLNLRQGSGAGTVFRIAVGGTTESVVYAFSGVTSRPCSSQSPATTRPVP